MRLPSDRRDTALLLLRCGYGHKRARQSRFCRGGDIELDRGRAGARALRWSAQFRLDGRQSGGVRSAAAMAGGGGLRDDPRSDLRRADRFYHQGSPKDPGPRRHRGVQSGGLGLAVALTPAWWTLKGSS
jgi:hypothetical protein